MDKGDKKNKKNYTCTAPPHTDSKTYETFVENEERWTKNAWIWSYGKTIIQFLSSLFVWSDVRSPIGSKTKLSNLSEYKYV